MSFWRSTVAPVKYRIVKDLLYPATLGSALAWFVQAFQRWQFPPLAADGAVAVPVPSAWSLWFAAWFLVCFGGWYVRLVKDETETSYQVREFVSDLVDILVIFLALASLHFVSSLYSDDYECWPFFVAGGASVSTWIARGFEPSSKWNVRVLKWKGWRNLLTIAALAVCVGAGAFIWMGWWVDAVSVWGLRALWGLLILYFVLVSKW